MAEQPPEYAGPEATPETPAAPAASDGAAHAPGDGPGAAITPAAPIDGAPGAPPLSPAPPSGPWGYSSVPSYPMQGYPPQPYPPQPYPPQAYPSQPLWSGAPASAPVAVGAAQPARRGNAWLWITLTALIGLLVAAASGIGSYTLGVQQGNQQGEAHAEHIQATAAAATTQTAIVAATQTAAATPTGTTIFQDPLTSNTTGWSVDPTHCFFGADGYHVSDRICFAPVGTQANETVSVQTRQISGATNYFYGLVLRDESEGNYYTFVMDGIGHWTFGKVTNNTYTDIVPIVPIVPSAAIHTGLGATNSLAVNAIGSHFEFFINGTRVSAADDTTFSSGYSGVEADQGIEVVYTNYAVSVYP